MKLLFIGDIVGRPGRDLIRRHVRALASQYEADLVIANGENAAGGAGITRENMLEILSAGVDVITTGNHVWDKRETLEFIGNEPRLLRPANYPDGTPGLGSCVVNSKSGVPVGVINVMGRVFLNAIDDPFRVALREIDRVREGGAQVIFVDMHGETTSEKIALSYYLDGKVAAVIGTHTHVQTADERILHEGTAYLTDLGMTGSYGGVIGMKKGDIINRFTSPIHRKPDHSRSEVRICGAIVDVDEATGRARSIERINLSHEQ